MVCPDCGSAEFTQTRIAQIEFTLTFEHGQWLDGAEEMIDSGERDAPITCGDCGAEVEDADLVSEDAYNAKGCAYCTATDEPYDYLDCTCSS